MKRTIIILICTILLVSSLTSPTMADSPADSVQISFLGSSVTIRVSAHPTALVTILVAKDGNRDVENIVYAMEQNLDSDGNGEFSFSFEDIYDTDKRLNGSYTCYLITDGALRAENVFYYMDKTERKNYIKGLNEANDVEKYLSSNASKSMFFAFDLNYNEFSSQSREIKTETFMRMKDSLPIDVDDDMAFYDAFCKAYLPSRINGAESYDIVSDILCKYKNANFELTFDDIDITANSDMLAFVSGYVYSNRNYSTPADINEAIKDAFICYAVNNADKRSLISVIEMYADSIGLAYRDEYKAYMGDGTVQKYVNEQLISNMPTGGYMDKKDVYEQFINAVNRYQSIPSGSGTGSSSGGGGSRGTLAAIGAEVPQAAFDTSNAGNSSFSDLTGYGWAANEIEALYNSGVINGYEDGTFRPENAVMREEFVRMIRRALELQSDGEISFSDVKSDDWFYEDVRVACGVGLIKGIEGNRFGTNQPISRQDSAVILARMLDITGIQVEAPKNTAVLADINQVSDYARDNVVKIQNVGIINGFEDGSFRPFGQLTRAQAAKIVYGLAEITGSIK